MTSATMTQTLRKLEHNQAARARRLDQVRREVLALRELRATQPHYAGRRLARLEGAAKFLGVW